MVRTSLCIACVLMPLAAASETVVFLDSAGRTELVDTAAPGEFAIPATPSATYAKAGGVAFNVFYYDVDAHTDAGFDDPEHGATRQARVAEVLDYLDAVLDHGGTCDIRFKISQMDGEDFGAQGGTFFSTTPGFTNGAAYEHITTGHDPLPGLPDIQITCDFGYPWYEGEDAPPSNQVDMKSVFLHELTHGLGFITLSGWNGDSRIAANVYSHYDRLLETGNGKALFGDGPPPIWRLGDVFANMNFGCFGGPPLAFFQGSACDLAGLDNGIRFAGPNAAAAFGSKPPIFAPDPFVLGSSLSHWHMEWKIAGNAVMEPVLNTGEAVRQYAPVELGALQDLGYKIREDIQPDDAEEE